MNKNFYSISLILIFLSLFQIKSTAQCITTSPTNQSVCAGTPAQFSVVASGSSITYQWQVYDNISSYVNITDNATYSGTATSILAVNTTTAMDGNLYRCIVNSTTCSGPNTSNPASLHTQITVSPLPSNLPICAMAPNGVSVNATGSNLSYKWQMQGPYPGMTTYTNITDNTMYGGRLMLNGSSTPTLTINYMMNGNYVQDGTKFRCIVYNSCEPSGVISSETQLVPMLIVNSPTNTSVCAGSTAQFTCPSSSYYNYPLTYQWQVNTGSGFTNITDNAVYSNSQTSILKINSTTTSMNGYSYMCTVSGGSCPGFSNYAILTVMPQVSIVSQPNNLAICSGANANFSVTAAGAGLTYQWQVNTGTGFTNLSNDATYSGVSSNNLQISNANASMNGWQYKVNVGSYCGNVTTNTSTLTINPAVNVTTPTDQTVCSGANTNYSVTVTGTAQSYQWQVNTGSGFSNISDGANYSGSSTNSLQVTNTDVSMDGWLYQVNVTTACGQVSSPSGKLSVAVPAQISSLTLDQNIHVGDPLALTLTSQGNYLTYNWSKDNVSLNDQSSSYNVTSASIQDTGTYKVQISNACGTTMPNYVHVSVTDIATQPTNDITNEGQTIIYTVDTYQTPTTYQWQVDNGTGFVNIVDGQPASGTATYSGATTNQLTITNASSGMNNYKYRCLIQTSAGDEYSNAATLTVNKVTGISTGVSTKLEVYPNPAQDYITINNLQENAVVTIYNQQGVLVKSIDPSGNYFSISDISQGYYILEVEQNNMVSRTPLVIK